MVKLKAYGICGGVLKWIEHFLRHRSQQVKVGETKSGKVDVLSGIPQGSILGPVLFTIFINDLPDSVLSSCYIFADDTKIFNKECNSSNIQNDIYKLQEWSDRWNLYFNASKCGVLHLGRTNQNSTYFMKTRDGLHQINAITEEKDLGVTFDKQFTFDAHIQRVVNKANQMLGIIKRSFRYLDRDVFLRLYKSFVRPHLEYANIIWNPFLKRQFIQIEKVQRRAMKSLNERRKMNYHERLHYII